LQQIPVSCRIPEKKCSCSNKKLKTGLKKNQSRYFGKMKPKKFFQKYINPVLNRKLFLGASFQVKLKQK